MFERKDERNGLMEEEARKRKERLLKLKQKTLINKDENGTSKDQNNNSEERPVLKFRNFEPTSELLIKKSGGVAPTGDNNEEQTQSLKRVNDGPLNAKTVEDEVEGLTKAVIEEQKERMDEEVNLTNLAPTKPNWDLKKDLAKKLNKLEHLTQVKIHEIVRDRVKGNSNGDSNSSGAAFVDAVNAQTQLDQEEIEQEED